MIRTPEELIASFGWSDAVREWLPGDASQRRYCRLRLGDRTCLLMDAPPPNEDVRPFCALAAYLRSLGLAAPDIFAIDTAQGYLLLEDFGKDTYTRILNQQPARAAGLYHRAVDVLVALHEHTPPTALDDGCGGSHRPGIYDQAMIQEHLSGFARFYLPAMGLPDRAPGLNEALAPLVPLMVPPARPVLALRDYHVDNLMVLDRPGVAQVGLLDFQDALAGHPAYDVMSLCQDARRDVGDEEGLIQRYLSATGRHPDDFLPSYWALGILRHLRVLGPVFARQWHILGNDAYLCHIPRVWRLLQADIDRLQADTLDHCLSDLVPKDRRFLPVDG